MGERASADRQRDDADAAVRTLKTRVGEKSEELKAINERFTVAIAALKALDEERKTDSPLDDLFKERSAAHQARHKRIQQIRALRDEFKK